MKKILVVLSVFLILLMVSCKEKKGGEGVSASTGVEMAEVFESSVDSINNDMDDIGGINLASITMREIFGDFFLQRANASSTPCTEWVANTNCSSGQKIMSYTNDCTIGSSSRTLDGSVKLSFYSSDGNVANDCVLAPTEYVTRTYTLSSTGPLGGIYHISSDPYTNYLNASIGGGGYLKKDSNTTYTYRLNGRHRWFEYGGSTIMNQSLHTGGDMTVSDDSINGLSDRYGRLVTGGSLIIDHNIARYTATLEPSNVTWGDSSCCYPTSGSVSVSFTGSVTGSGTLTFLSTCGKGTWEKDGTSTDLTFNYCGYRTF